MLKSYHFKIAMFNLLLDGGKYLMRFYEVKCLDIIGRYHGIKISGNHRVVYRVFHRWWKRIQALFCAGYLQPLSSAKDIFIGFPSV